MRPRRHGKSRMYNTPPNTPVAIEEQLTPEKKRKYATYAPESNNVKLQFDFSDVKDGYSTPPRRTEPDRRSTPHYKLI